MFWSQSPLEAWVQIPLLTSQPLGFPHSSVGKSSACSDSVESIQLIQVIRFNHLPARGSIPRSGRSPRERNGNPVQYSCLENPMDRGAWRATVHGFARVGQCLSSVSCSRKLIKPKEGVVETPIYSQRHKLHLKQWRWRGHSYETEFLNLQNLMRFPSREYKNCVELLDTQLTLESCVLVWEALLLDSHTLELGAEVFPDFSYIAVYYISMRSVFWLSGCLGYLIP